MTLDEAIKHAEEVAEEKKAQAWEAQLQEEYEKIKLCKKCAKERRQLAEWLKDYKRLLEQEPCEDCISRQAVLAIAGDSCLDLDSYEDTKEFCDEIKELPPVNPQPKTGHWIYVCNSEVNGLKICKCSNCKKKTYGSHNYCPNCGAKMEDKENES